MQPDSSPSSDGGDVGSDSIGHRPADARGLAAGSGDESGQRRSAPGSIHTITDAPRPLSEDIQQRMNRYWVLMGIRVGCFLSMAVVPQQWWWACIAGAVLLPVVAVLVANSGPAAEKEDAPLAATRARDLAVHSEQADPEHDDAWEKYLNRRPGEYLR